MYTEDLPQPTKAARPPPQQGLVASNSFLNRFAGFGVQRPIQTLKVPVQLDNTDLDKRVRESGEW